jgi:hypothetical protein
MALAGVGAESMARLPETALRDPLGRVPCALRISALRLRRRHAHCLTTEEFSGGELVA